MKYLIAIFVLILMTGCNAQEELNAIKSMKDDHKVWIFAQFNVKEGNDDQESYYYYGKISKKLYDAISFNEIERGFILLENVKYWGDGDLIYDYRDIESSGEIIFRIENIVKMEKINIEPIPGRGAEQFEDPDSTKHDNQIQNSSSTVYKS